MAIKARTWSDIPSSSDLAELVSCEAKAVWERNTGQTRQDARRSFRSRVGEQAHKETEVVLEHFRRGKAD